MLALNLERKAEESLVIVGIDGMIKLENTEFYSRVFVYLSEFCLDIDLFRNSYVSVDRRAFDFY